jgi:hypothetical protein
VGKADVAELSVEAGHYRLQDTMVLARRASNMDHLVKEAIQIQLYPNSFNMDVGFIPSRFRYPASNILQ